MSIAALLTIDKMWQQTKCSSTDEWKKKMWYVYTHTHTHSGIIQFSSVPQSCPTLCDPMNCSTPGLPVHHQLPEFALRLTSIKSMMPSSRLILCRPLLLLPPPSIKVFSNESTLRLRWPKHFSFRFNINAANEHPGLISFRMD